MSRSQEARLPLYTNLTRKGAWPSNPVHGPYCCYFWTIRRERKREREVGYSSKVLHIERGRSRELCGTSSRDPPLPVVILIRDLLAGRRSLLQEIALRDPVASLSMHGPTAGTTLRLKIPRRSQRAWDLLISHQSIAVLLFYSFMITEKSFSLANLNGGIYFNFTFLRNRM